MPPRGRAKERQGAMNHGRQLPEDHVDLWYCIRGHVFFTIGPVVAYGNVIQCRYPTPAYGSHGVRAVLCRCGFTWSARLPIPRELQLAARASWRIEGESGVFLLLGSWVAEKHGRVIHQPYFRNVDTPGALPDFPESSMTEALQQSHRYHTK